PFTYPLPPSPIARSVRAPYLAGWVIHPITIQFLAGSGVSSQSSVGLGLKAQVALPLMRPSCFNYLCEVSLFPLIGINSPAALLIRRSHVSHSPIVHCSFWQSNSQSATSLGTG
ncbi:MAG: hypothetical protein WAK20_00450, partial [Candidatus Acidiferrum sp.]